MIVGVIYITTTVSTGVDIFKDLPISHVNGTNFECFIGGWPSNYNPRGWTGKANSEGTKTNIRFSFYAPSGSATPNNVWSSICSTIIMQDINTD